MGETSCRDGEGARSPLSSLPLSLLYYIVCQNVAHRSLHYDAVYISRENLDLAAYRQERGGGMVTFEQRHNNAIFMIDTGRV